MDRNVPPAGNEGTPRDATNNEPENREETELRDRGPDDVNPPRTTTGHITSPKFGSAGSGGAELEPGPPKP
jgi:hypothetical protein